MIIYKATNLVNGKVYIGQTKQGLDKRKRRHIASSKYKDGIQFHNAIRKYGKENFKWEIIDEANTKEELNELEIKYIEEYDSINNGYNMVAGGHINVMDFPDIKRKHKLKMSSKETRDKISNTLKRKAKNGELFTDEHRKHLSEKAKGNHNWGTGDTRSIGCYCILNNKKYEFHLYRDGWQWWCTIDNPFDSNVECLYQRKIKQSIEKGYYTYKHKTYYEPRWYKKKEGDTHEKVSN